MSLHSCIFSQDFTIFPSLSHQSCESVLHAHPVLRFTSQQRQPPQPAFLLHCILVCFQSDVGGANDNIGFLAATVLRACPATLHASAHLTLHFAAIANNSIPSFFDATVLLYISEDYMILTPACPVSCESAPSCMPISVSPCTLQQGLLPQPPALRCSLR